MKTCPIVEAINIIGSKARLIIIRHLGNKSLGFNELKRRTKLSSRTLSLNLKFLLKNKIITKTTYKNRVLYSLTEKGKDLYPILTELGEWNKKWKIKK